MYSHLLPTFFFCLASNYWRPSCSTHYMVKALNLHRAFIHSTSQLASNSPSHTLTYSKCMVNGLAFISCFSGVQNNSKYCTVLVTFTHPRAHSDTNGRCKELHNISPTLLSRSHSYLGFGISLQDDPWASATTMVALVTTMESTGLTTRSNLRRRGQESSRVWTTDPAVRGQPGLPVNQITLFRITLRASSFN